MFKTYDENKGKLVWRLWVILIVELLGTFAMVFEIIAPNSFLSNFDLYNQIFGTFIMKALWVTVFIWILIQICGKVSVNLNPAVTISEVTHGAFGWNRASLMILMQVIGAITAAEVAYQIAEVMGTTNTSLDAVKPVLQVPGWMAGDAFNTTTVIFSGYAGYGETFGQAMLTVIPTISIESILTFALLSSVFYGNFNNPEKDGPSQSRALVIFGVLTGAVYIGIFTLNISLNPARMIGPALVGTAHSGSALINIEQNLQYAWMYLAGQLIAVMIFAIIEYNKKEKTGETRTGYQKEVRLLATEVLVTKARYEWLIAGNKAIEEMNKEELVNALSFCKVDFSKKESRDDLEYDLVEWIIFGLESNEHPPKVKAIPAKKNTAEKKVPAKKAIPDKKAPAKKSTKTTKKPITKK